MSVGLTLPGEDARRLEELAREIGVSRRELVRRIVEAYLMGQTWVRS